jgi:uncharacterized protein (TIGR02996 family)
MTIESDFIDAINADPDNRFHQLIYADWLDEQADPRAEAWRVLIEQGKRPFQANERGTEWDWYITSKLDRHNFPLAFWKLIRGPQWKSPYGFLTFHAAMDAAAIVWVRTNRDEEFMREPVNLSEIDR